MKKTKASKKTRTRKRDFPPLDNKTSQKQLAALNDASAAFLSVVKDTTVVPIGYMRNVFSTLSTGFRSDLKTRRVDPIERKRLRLEAKIVKYQEELNAIKKNTKK